MFKNLSSKHLGVSGSQNELIELALSFGFKGFDLDIVRAAVDGMQCLVFQTGRSSRRRQ